MVYYTHSIIDEKMVFEYVTHNNSYFIYKLYNSDYPEKTFLMIYHIDCGFNVIRESKFNMNDFETNFKSYFNYDISSRHEYNSSRGFTNGFMPVERQFGCHKYEAVAKDIEKYKKLLLDDPSTNINLINQEENGIIGAHIFHFVPNIFCVNIGTMYRNNEIDSSYILVEYNGDSFQLRYEQNNGDLYFM